MDRKGSGWNPGVVPSIISNQLLRWQSHQSSMLTSGTAKTKAPRQGMLITKFGRPRWSETIHINSLSDELPQGSSTDPPRFMLALPGL